LQDNILKNFANALSVVLTVLGAIPLFGMWPSPWFLAGIASVLLSVSMYSGAAPGPPRVVLTTLHATLKAAPWLGRAGRDAVVALGLDRGGLGGQRPHPVSRGERAAARKRVGGFVLTLAAAAGVWVLATGDGRGGGRAGLGRRGLARPALDAAAALDPDPLVDGASWGDAGWAADAGPVERVRPGDADGDAGGRRRAAAAATTADVLGGAHPPPGERLARHARDVARAIGAAAGGGAAREPRA
jgi:hypothetical protein